MEGFYQGLWVLVMLSQALFPKRSLARHRPAASGMLTLFGERLQILPAMARYLQKSSDGPTRYTHRITESPMGYSGRVCKQTRTGSPLGRQTIQSVL